MVFKPTSFQTYLSKTAVDSNKFTSFSVKVMVKSSSGKTEKEYKLERVKSAGMMDPAVLL